MHGALTALKREVQLMEGRTDEHGSIICCLVLYVVKFRQFRQYIYNTVVVISMYPYNSYNILQFCTSKKRYKSC